MQDTSFGRFLGLVQSHKTSVFELFSISGDERIRFGRVHSQKKPLLHHEIEEYHLCPIWLKMIKPQSAGNGRQKFVEDLICY